MQDYFYTLADAITALLKGDEVYTCTFRGEDSDFVRFNCSAVRQAGTASSQDGNNTFSRQVLVCTFGRVLTRP